MGTQLILTVGTNALPVWVAWYHLKDILEQPITVRFVYTADTESQKDLLETHCAGATFGQHIRTSPGALGTVRQNVKDAILQGLEDGPHLHVHYTGGTKVMGVETVSAIESELPRNIRMDTTYLDPRGNAGPRIMSRHRILRADARQGVDADLEHIARLNGFELGDFTHEHWDYDDRRYVQKNRSAPAILDDKQQQIGEQVLNNMSTHGHHAIIRASKYFEYAAYIAFQKALTRIETRSPDRNNYAIFNNVYVRQTGANIRDPIFELDVVGVLGYQVVLVTCTLFSGRGMQKTIKMKGMEGIERVQQLGGDEAKVIVLCKAHQDAVQNLEKEFYRPGSDSTPVKVWGTAEWTDLPSKFERYLRNTLHWR